MRTVISAKDSIVTDEPNNSTEEPREESLDAAPAPVVGNGQGNQAAGPERQEPPGDEVTGQAEAPSSKPAEEEASAPQEAAPEAGGEEKPQMDWYILKVQSNREDTIREALERRIKIDGMEDYFGDIIVPTEMVSEFKNGKKRVVKRKLYPGYIMIQMAINDETWFLVRDTPGIGDFTGSGGKPIPMQEHEVSRLLAKQEEKTAEAPKLKIGVKPGDRVKINEGTFENFEGEVESIDEANGRVTVMISIFGRSTPVELEYWHIEAV